MARTRAPREPQASADWLTICRAPTVAHPAFWGRQRDGRVSDTAYTSATTQIEVDLNSPHLNPTLENGREIEGVAFTNMRRACCMRHEPLKPVGNGGVFQASFNLQNQDALFEA